jgi:putative ABC transport system permease protein
MQYRRERRLRDWWRSPSDIAADIDEEIGFHLDMRAETLMRSGLSRDAALDQARAEFGDAAQLRRELRRRDHRREQWRRVGMWCDDVRRDIRFAVRSLVRSPGFTAVALGTLILGMGSSVAMFAVVDGVLLRPLPYPQPDRLVHVWPGHNFNIALVDAVGSGAPSLESWSGLSIHGLTLTGRGEAALLMTQAVDAGYFDVLRVRPQLGRGFGPDHRDPALAGVVILSDALWRSRFGGDESIIGQRIDVDGYGHSTREVIGVMPRGFVPPLADGAARIDLWVPLQVPPGRTVATDSTWYVNNVIGRLRPDAGVAGLAAEVGTQLAHIRSESGNIISEEAIRTAGAAGLMKSMVGTSRGTLWRLFGAVGLVLLLACANLVNLLLARGERRRAELAARAALGGTRARLVRELVTESALLAVAGAAGGVLLARMILDVLRVADTSGLPRSAHLAVDARVAAFALIIAVGSLLLFAVLPALRVTGGDLRPDLGSGRRTQGATRSGRRLGAVLTAAEVALAMLLVTAAALLIQSFRTVRGIDPGMDTRDVLAVQIAPPSAEYRGEQARLLYDQLIERLAALPGVRTVGAIHLLPFTPNNWGFPYLAEGHDPPVNAPLPSANFRVVTPDYFAAVDVPLLAGRTFESHDAAGGAPVGIINRTLAEQLWPGQDAVGREIMLFGNTPFRVVGVVGDVHQHALESRPEPEIYRPFAQWTLASMVLLIETERDPAASAGAAREAIAGVDPRIPVVAARPLADVLGDSLAQRRFLAGVLTGFGLLALLLGGIGVYGVAAYSVGARVAEFSLRMALGASPADVVRQALRTGLAPVLFGLVAGTLAALAAARLLESLLFDVHPRDPAVLGTAALVLGIVALLATWVPAQRLRRVDPASVLNAG